MKGLINQLGVADQFKLSAVVQVEELMDHDMIYVYHHLTEGKFVELKRCGTNVYGDPRFEVKFQQFKLGVVTVGGILRSFYQDSDTVIAEIVGLSKQKFMPIKELDIKIGVQALKKVG